MKYFNQNILIQPRHKLDGFTLIEVMIVMVIVGVLAAIAYPAYTKMMIQSRRSDAQVALMRISAAQEKYYSDCGVYAATLVGTRSCGNRTAGDASTVLGYDPTSDLSPDGHYQLSLAAGPITTTGCSGSTAAYDCGFIAIANPNGTGVTARQNNNGRLRIDSKNTQQWDKSNNNFASGIKKWTDK